MVSKKYQSRKYKIKHLVMIARRYNNEKRSYLLVNPLQAKHMPVNPSDALKMMRTLGNKAKEKYPDARLVIGFAETATAIGAEVAMCISEECVYVHTTRESVQPCIEFLEEHSHAPEQRLFCGKLNEWLENTPTVIFVDDEISTGKTLLNVIRQLKSAYPAFNDKKLVAVSIINRLSDEDENALRLEGVECEYLVKMQARDIDVSKIRAQAPQKLMPVLNFDYDVSFVKIKMPPNPKYGVVIGEYFNSIINHFGKNIAELLQDKKYKSVLVVGTEEFMMPAISTAASLCLDCEVKTQSTTRSPIGVNNRLNSYPIQKGYQLRSVYDENRITYIYNLCPDDYDLVIFIADVKSWNNSAVEDIMAICQINGYKQLIFVGDADNV